jgi:nicotinamidase-related amidase
MQSTEAYEFWPELSPLADEQVLEKTYPSAFFGTTLTSQLVYHGIDTLVVTGTVTSGCVRGTCLDAFNLNYRVIVPEDCVCDRGAVSHKVALFEIQMKYGDVVKAQDVLGELARLASA